MATCVKIFTFVAVVCCIFFSTAKADEKQFTVINTAGPDIPFREILIEKSMEKDAFSCTITQDTFENALKKLSLGTADIVLVKKSPDELKLDDKMTAYQYSATPIFAAVNKRNPLKKISISDLQKIWNNDYSTWSVFDEKNIFSIHRFGMRHDDGSFLYLKDFLRLRQDAIHFPLETSQQIITMTAANPNAISIFAYEKELDFSKVNLLQLTDDNGKNLNLNMPHTAVFLKINQQKIKNFLKVPKNR